MSRNPFSVDTDETSNVVNLALAAPDVAAMPSEDSVARTFTARHRENLRYDHTIGRWYEWDGTRWVQDKTRKAFEYARRILHEQGRGERAMARAGVAAGVEKFAQSDPAHAVTQEVWDRAPFSSAPRPARSASNRAT